jgi:predicted phosphodiesterase
MIVSILHICDLHRDPSHEITNKTLLNSLQRDIERYNGIEDPLIKTPHLIIVSGDIIQGVKADSPGDVIEELKRQYEEAASFLSDLAGIFLNDEKDKIIIVPGNHDVSAYHFASCLKKLAIDKNDLSIKKIVQQLFLPRSILRWSWDILDFFEIADLDRYHRRLEPFCNFYAGFYNNKRNLDINPEKQFDIFDYHQYNISIAAFNSCFNTDLYNLQGAINPDCIANAADTLRHRKYNGWLRLAVWHHNVSGAPLQSDYMDSDILQILIDNNFSIGFHGHQHKPHFIDERFQYGGDRKITVISAGTLCGGPGSLPSGHPRSYNIVELDTEKLTARLHLRTMLNEKFDSPIWGPGTFSLSRKSYVDFTVQPSFKTFTDRMPPISDLAEAERLLHGSKCEEAVKILKPISSEYEIARRLLLECFVKMDDIESIIEYFDPPRSITEIVHLADALWEKKEMKRLKSLLISDVVTKCTDPSVCQVVKKYSGRLEL